MEREQEGPTRAKPDKLPKTMADITPLEPRVDDFNTSNEQAGTASKHVNGDETLPSLQIHTPPETPEHYPLPHVSAIAGDVDNDPPLYPDTPLRDRNRSLSPLLGDEDYAGKKLSKATQLLELTERNEHSLSSERFRRNSYSPHRRTETATYPGILGIKSAQDALDFHRSCVEEQKRFHAVLALPAPARSSKGSRRDATSTQQLSRLNRSAGISKPRSISPRPVPKPVATTATPAPIATQPRKASATKKRVTKPKASSEGPSETAPGQKKHTRAAPTKNVSTQKWTEIEDFTPPLSTLDGKSYDIKWDGSIKDISGEPDVQHLHDLEARWASKLRLDPRQYLATKRLIFKERVAYLRQNKAFTKTAAQSSARLDVNKLSRLHMAFDSVGWFDEKHFQQFLQ